MIWVIRHSAFTVTFLKWSRIGSMNEQQHNRLFYPHSKVLRENGTVCMRSQGQTANVTFNLSLIRANGLWLVLEEFIPKFLCFVVEPLTDCWIQSATALKPPVQQLWLLDPYWGVWWYLIRFVLEHFSKSFFDLGQHFDVNTEKYWTNGLWECFQGFKRLHFFFGL